PTVLGPFSSSRGSAETLSPTIPAPAGEALMCLSIKLTSVCVTSETSNSMFTFAPDRNAGARLEDSACCPGLVQLNESRFALPHAPGSGRSSRHQLSADQ